MSAAVGAGIDRVGRADAAGRTLDTGVSLTGGPEHDGTGFEAGFEAVVPLGFPVVALPAGVSSRAPADAS